MLFAAAAAARIGIRMFDVAVLLVNSEKNVTETQSVARTASVGQSRSTLDEFADRRRRGRRLRTPWRSRCRRRTEAARPRESAWRSANRGAGCRRLRRWERETARRRRRARRSCRRLRRADERRPAAERNLARDPGERGQAEHREHAFLRDRPLALRFRLRRSGTPPSFQVSTSQATASISTATMPPTSSHW